MLVGLTVPTAGTIVVCGRDRSAPARSARERRRRGSEVQVVFQNPYTSLDPRQSAAQAIDEVLRLHRGDARRGARGAGARARRARRPRRPPVPCPSARALGRPAPAHRDRARARRRAAGDHPRRVRRGARRLDPGADPQPACRYPRRDRRALRAHQPRPRGRPSITDEAIVMHRGRSSSAVRPRRCSTRPATSTRRCCVPASPGAAGRLGGVPGLINPAMSTRPSTMLRGLTASAGVGIQCARDQPVCDPIGVRWDPFEDDGADRGAHVGDLGFECDQARRCGCAARR